MPSVTWNLGAVIRDLNQIGRQAPAALAKSLNRSASAVQTAARKAVTAELNIRAGDLREQKLMRLNRATSRDLEAKLTVAARPAPLILFRGTRETRRGVSVKIKRRGARKIVRGAFIERSRRAGRLAVLTRTMRTFISGRLPIRELFGISVVQFLDDEPVLVKLHMLARSAFEKTLDHEIQFRLAKRKAA